MQDANTAKSKYQFYSEKKRKNAEEEVRELLRKKPHQPDYIYYWGLIHLDRKDYFAAIEIFLNCLDVDKNHVEAYYGIIGAMREIRNFSKAEQYLVKLEKIISENNIWHLDIERALNALAQKQYKKSIEVTKNSLERNGEIAELYINLGSIYLEMSEFDLAIEKFKKAEQCDRAANNLAFHLAKTYIILDDYERAEEYLDKIDALQIPRLYWEVNICRELFERERVRLTQVEDDLLEVYRDDLDNAEVLYQLGCVNVLKKDFDAAIKNLEKSIVIDKYCLKSQLLLSNCLRQEHKLAELENHLQQIERLNLKTLDWIIYLHKALTCISESHFREAIEYINLALDIYPENAVLHFYQGHSFSNLNDIESSVVSLRKAISLDPCMFRAHLNLATYLRNFDKFKEALDILNRIPETIDLEVSRRRYFEKSLCYELLHQRELSKIALHKAVELVGEGTESLESFGKLFENYGEYYYSLIAYSKLIENDKGYHFT